MTGKLQAEIKQQRPFASLEQEVFLSLERTSDALTRQMAEVLKPAGLTGTQYNVLRILRGAEPAGLTCGEVGGRMITHDPDITRMLDRLEKRGLIVRSRDARDRRVIITRITPAGLQVLERLDEPVTAEHRRLLRHITQESLQRLADLLEEVRQKID